MNQLVFEKLSRFDRPREPVTVSIPFANGIFPADSGLRVWDGDRELAVQTRALATWPDGSVKWVLVHLQPDLPGNRAHTLRFEPTASANPVPPGGPTVSVTEGDGGLRIDTGVLAFRVPREGFRPICDVVLNGNPLWSDPFDGFHWRDEGGEWPSTQGAVTLSIEETGPLLAVIELAGRHRGADGTAGPSFRGRITAYAGKPFIEVEHQFLHTETAAEIRLQALALRWRPADRQGAPRLALGEGYYRTGILESNESVAMALTAETLLYQANEHFVDSFYGDFWVDWRDDRGGLTLSIHQAHQNFPKKLTADRDGVACWLYPDDAPPARILPGMAKTHRIQLHFHGPSTPLDDVSTRSLQFQMPDRPALPAAWYRKHNPWIETFFPEKLPGRLYTYLNRLHDGRPGALGMLHFGDAADANYTNQGRGGGERVWVNNEYDRPHACTLYYALSGQRRVLDSALVCARHWLDVDFCHQHADPLIHGGLRIHSHYHATGGCTPSHEWTEGFLDYYFLTGRREALEAARSVGENILRHLAQPAMRQPGSTAVREGGWGLRAMVGLWLGTGESRWRDEATRLVDLFLAWHTQYGALLAPYTSHTMPRVPFMIALTVNSFGRYLLLDDDARVKRLILDVVNDLIAHCLGPDGIFFYKELPSLQRTAPTPHVLEALTYAYRVSGNERYLKIAANTFAAMATTFPDRRDNRKTIDPCGAVLIGEGGARPFADKFASLLLFAGAATPLGLLDGYEYPFPGAGPAEQ